MVWGVALVIVAINLMSATVRTDSQCGLYGTPPCQFVPAPPGQTPSCAGPGKTYCENIEHYPTYLIKHLVHKWGYESRNIIVDETGDDFESLKVRRLRHPNNFYDPSSLFQPPGLGNQVDQFEGYKYSNPNISPGGFSEAGSPDPIYIPKPRETDYLLYTALSAATQFNTKPNNNNYFRPKVSHYNQNLWLKRFGRDLNRAKDRYNSTLLHDSTERDSLTEGTSVEQRHRPKRQSAGRVTLCQSTSQYITPQAALNSKGNWMYVVNEANTARQLVKTETCASSQCSNLCQLPIGYNSRCEQKYVQKRLVALNADGQNLYTDTFWFPSCCKC
ncbi:unnamed protein product [Hermetia illucens]|uniref:Spaetzle domain-containing protein n=1 Tax=Hermetia illucens TaxID=343691 RepID=A0A7R8YTX8_HERIL|nr:protein spaetzle 5 isoform X2 [Hermetia illucens]CAD7082169.1 unnamed protein product [Hermetia illucens]